eukprot:TRINITY_DN107222_c0_g1_i1.p3 TRINITY_DN107222_c0_g1~~TRINITY_DN107222_c0_g1_i1.p3  ORF type:complete len:102 (+),score=14.35 TRINITY_DN107222_c0_g1_i1:264-569(+)
MEAKSPVNTESCQKDSAYNEQSTLVPDTFLPVKPRADRKDQDKHGEKRKADPVVEPCIQSDRITVPHFTDNRPHGSKPDHKTESKERPSGNNKHSLPAAKP